MRQYKAYFDGACWPNPNGHAACGAFIEALDGERIFEHAEYLGNENTTNNLAEYTGLIAILGFTAKFKDSSEIHIYGDSDLVVKQMTGVWKAGTLTRAERKGKVPIKPRHYLPFYHKAKELLTAQSSKHLIWFHWIPREENTDADELSTRPLRQRGYREEYGRRRNADLDDAFENAISK